MKKILLIEDMKGISESLKMILQSNDYHVTVAHDGAEGLELTQKTTFDLIVTDILLPKMDGNEFMIAFKKHDSRTPILAISGGGRGVSSAKALELSKNFASHVLEKPFSTNDFISAVNTAIGEAE